ncbi:hypothetical protein NECAME_14429 [Necator americanus]|uniref:Uncharacterized protein n=1 Tax=Necator americanus TaxID=51031 RepID=W2SQ06_NECAM|nr:hypothetical protein NECAME_14429 [Necator americanus]ETN70961.1 hypothetical protein NECAME_14429 [Necator americanus]
MVGRFLYGSYDKNGAVDVKLLDDTAVRVSPSDPPTGCFRGNRTKFGVCLSREMSESTCKEASRREKGLAARKKKGTSSRQELLVYNYKNYLKLTLHSFDTTTTFSNAFVAIT